MSAKATGLRLELAARPENLALVRQALTGLADAVSIPEEPLADLKQIATEACLNAVVHAYPDDGVGPILVRAEADAGQVQLSVRDWGRGFEPRPATPEGDSLRLGMPLMASLSDSFEVTSHGEGGTEVRARVLISPNGNGAAALAQPEPGAREASVEVTAGEGSKPVISRVIALAATRAGLSLERMSDSVLLGDVIAGRDPADFPEGRVAVEITDCTGGRLQIRVGPFVEGGAQRMVEGLEVPGLGVSLAKLANKVETESDDSGDFVTLEIAA